MKPEDVAHEAHRVLTSLQAPVTSGRVKIPPPTKAIMLIHSHKGAAVVGYERGHGLLMRVLGWEENGRPKLSPPVIVKLTKFGIGFAIGFNSVYTLMLIDSDDQVTQLCTSSETVLGKDLALTGLPYTDSAPTDSSIQRNTMTLVNHVEVGGSLQPRVISVSDSFMVCDISFVAGSISVDGALMAEAYGKEVAAVDVVHGKVEAPAALAQTVQRIAADLHTLSGSQ